METIDYITLGAFVLGQIGGILWAILNWKNPQVDGVELISGALSGGIIGMFTIGLIPFIIIWLIGDGLQKLRKL